MDKFEYRSLYKYKLSAMTKEGKHKSARMPARNPARKRARKGRTGTDGLNLLRFVFTNPDYPSHLGEVFSIANAKLEIANLRRLKKQSLFIVEAIMGHRVVGSVTMYHVKWHGYPHESNTWEPATNLVNNLILEKYIRSGNVQA